MLSATVARTRGAFTLDVTLDVPRGTTCAVVGESGAGKSTLLRVLAGVLRPDRGRIVLDDAVWCDTAAGGYVEPWDRPVGYVPQDYALFPHLTLLDNVAFGLRARGMAVAEARERAHAALGPFGIAGLAGQRPTQLSGGQQQRGALARALVTEPALLLLDEPLSALDRASRASALDELERVLAGLSCVTLYVTHAEDEAARMGGMVVRMASGSIDPM